MKTTLALLLLTCVALSAPNSPGADVAGQSRTTAATPPSEEEVILAGGINFTGADLTTVLIKYAEMVNRSVLRPPQLLAPNFCFVNQTPLTKAEAIQVYQRLFAMNQVAVIEVGDKYLKAVPAAESIQSDMPTAGGSFSDRVNQIISRAAKTGGSGEFPIIGPNKIVANSRQNTLMVFASRGDMATITKSDKPAVPAAPQLSTPTKK